MAIEEKRGNQGRNVVEGFIFLLAPPFLDFSAPEALRRAFNSASR